MMRWALALCVLAGAASAEPPIVGRVTPELLAAAVREGEVSLYTAIDLEVATKLAEGFRAKYPGITLHMERSGSERNYQRVAQEYASGIHAVDVIDSTDVAHLLDWKRQGLLAAYMPEDVAAPEWPAAHRDGDGYYADSRGTLSVIAYNTKLVRPEEAPRGFADLLDPRWKGRMVKAHPAYSGNILTATFAMSQALGWPYLEKLGAQRVLQVQSASEPIKKLILGERAVMVDGTEHSALRAQNAGAPIAIVYPVEGVPLLPGSTGIMKDAPHPNAARVLLGYIFSSEGQRILSAEGERVFHPAVPDPPGRTPLARLKLLATDPAAQEAASEEIKQRYREYFGT